MSVQSDSRRWGVIIIVVIFVIAAILFLLRPPPPNPLIPTEKAVITTPQTDESPSTENIPVTATTEESPPTDIIPETDTTEAPSPTDTPAETDTLESPVTNLQFWFSGTSKEAESISKQISDFEIKFPGTSITMRTFTAKNDSEEEIDVELISAQGADTFPDIATVSFSRMIVLQQAEVLSELGTRGTIDLQSFVREAIESGQIDENQIGLPMRRFGCSQSYQFLSIFKSSTQQDRAIEFIEFLTQSEQQNQNFDQLDWIPTRQSSYDLLNSKKSCPVITPIPQTVEEVQESVRVVKNAIDNHLLDDVLDGQQLNPYNAVTVIEKDKGGVQGTAAALLTTPATDAEARELLEGEGLVLGAVFIVKAPEYYSGNYVAECRINDSGQQQQQTSALPPPARYRVTGTLYIRDGPGKSFREIGYLKADETISRRWGPELNLNGAWIPVVRVEDGLIGWAHGFYLAGIPPDNIPSTCELSDGKTSFEVTPEISQELPTAVEKPVVLVEPGSKRVCWYIRRHRYCIRIG